MLTYPDQEANRKDRLNEVGTEPDCPFCKKPRVSRSDYIRCNLCGINWLNEEMNLPNYLNLDPRVSRREAAPMVSGMPRTAVQQAESANK